MTDKPTDDRADAPARKPVRKAAWVRGAESSSLGIEIAVSVCVPMVGAHYLEQHVTHWTPWTTLLGVALGLFVAANAVMRTARQYQDGLKADREAEAAEAAQADAEPPS